MTTANLTSTQEALAARLKELLGGVTSEEELLGRLAKPWERELLWRCALPLRFDRETLKDVLTDKLDTGLSHDALAMWLSAHGDIEASSEPRLVMCVRDSVRRQSLEQTLDPATGDGRRYRELADRLMRHFRRRGAACSIDALSLELVADPVAGLRRARRLFRAAEQRVDFSRCLQLVNVLEDRAALVRLFGSSTDEALGMSYRTLLLGMIELRRRYEASRAFATDFERTAHVLKRKEMRAAWKWVTSKPRRARSAKRQSVKKRTRSARTPWIMDLEAQGGAGKTVFLRWLAARKCLPAGIPYARLDFDFIDPRLTRVAPWYLLAQLARSLDPQLPGRPLRGLVERADDVVDFDSFSLSPTEAARALEQLGSESARSQAFGAIEEFGNGLNTSHAPAIVIVLDTLEVALLDPDAELMPLLLSLEEVHRLCPRLRVILSGRFDLSKKVAGFSQHFEGDVWPLELTRLTLEESRDYLVKQRGMRDGPVVRAIAARSGGLAFALSMFADEWQIQPTLTASEVRDIPGPELHYLVERVLKRVPRPIAWLVRYGVVARRLTPGFVADVVVPELERLRAGRSADNPLRDSAVVRQYFDDARATLGQEVLSPEKLWSDLKRHASTFSFVSQDVAMGDVLVLHEDVVRPMRRELAKHPVLRRLHRAAMQQATRRGGGLTDTNTAEWIAEQREALYHALRVSPTVGRQLWRRIRASTSRQHYDAVVAQLAAEVLEATVDLPTDLKLDAAQARTEAFVSLAQRDIEQAPAHWRDAHRAHQTWSGLLKPDQRKRSAPFHIARVRIAAQSGVARRASLRALLALLRRARTPSDRLALHAALATGSRTNAAKLRHIEAARAIVAAGKHRWDATSVLRFQMECSDAFMGLGRHDEALRTISRVVTRSHLLTLAEQVDALALHVRLLGTCERFGKLDAARHRVARLDSAIVQDGIVRDLGAYARRAVLRRELAKLQALGGPTAPATLAVGDEPWSWVAALDCLTSAELARAAVDPAALFEQIALGRQVASGREKGVRALLLCTASAASIELLGDMPQAREFLREAWSLSVSEGDEPWMRLRFLACVLGWEGAHALRELRRVQRRHGDAYHGILAEVAALALAAHAPQPSRTRLQREASVRLRRALEQVTPVAARRHCLTELLPPLEYVPLAFGERDRMMATLGLRKRPSTASHPTDVLDVLSLWCDLDSPTRVVTSSAAAARWMVATGKLSSVVSENPEALHDVAVPTFTRGVATLGAAQAASQAGDSARALTLGQQALELLTAQDSPPSIWTVRTLLLLFHLGGQYHERAAVWALAAEEIAERLGASAELRQAQVYAAAANRAVQTTHTIDDDEQFLVDGEANSWGFKAPLHQAVTADLASVTSRRLPDRVVAEMVRDFPGTLRELARTLALDKAGVQAKGRLVVVASRPTFAALPFEAALAHHTAQQAARGRSVQTVQGWRSTEAPRREVNERWAHRAFGRLSIEPPKGQNTFTDVIRTFQQGSRLPATGVFDALTLRHLVRALREQLNPAVAVILPMQDYGSSNVAESIYHGQPADVTVVRDGSKEVLTALRSKAFDIVHIVAPILESSSFGGLAFQLAGAGAKGRNATPSGLLGLSELAGALKRGDSLLRPVVIVNNCLQDLSPHEVIRQYCLRNIMALELARSGAPVATVAVSSHRYAGPAEVLQFLLEVLLDGSPLLHFVDLLRARTTHDGAALAPPRSPKSPHAMVEVLETFGTSIFANNPAYITV